MSVVLRLSKDTQEQVRKEISVNLPPFWIWIKFLSRNIAGCFQMLASHYLELNEKG